MTTGSAASSAGPRAGLLEGKVCVVSGVGPGLGRRAAVALAAHGADVVLAARRQSSLDDVATEVEALGVRALVVPTNIVDVEQCERVMSLARSELGGIDVLVNNAFRFDVFQTFEEVDLDVWRKIMDVNLFGSLQMTKAALPAMEARGGGSVVMVASMAARQPTPLEGGYTVSKGALMTATRVLAYELGSKGIRVNAVVPGWMLGPSVDVYVQMTSDNRGITPEAVVDELAARMALGRVPTDEEVAGSIVYLASDLSSVVTGQAIDANGGEYFAVLEPAFLQQLQWDAVHPGECGLAPTHDHRIREEVALVDQTGVEGGPGDGRPADGHVGRGGELQVAD
jgi:NAD(P)-dependent dehydrogenase (short-subunit alcohol dehydrogenase family)